MSARSFTALALAVAVVAARGASAPTQEPPNNESKRLKRVAGYLKLSGAALYGERKAREIDFSPPADNLWARTREQYEAVFGTTGAADRFPASGRSVKALEERVFDVLEALWGKNWPEVIHPDR